MFSGKSEEMIRRLRRAEIAGQRVVIFKPRIDDRYDATETHTPKRVERFYYQIVKDRMEPIRNRMSCAAEPSLCFFKSTANVQEALASFTVVSD